MKKVLCILLVFFSSILILTGCSKENNPSCELELNSTENSVSYTLTFKDLGKKQNNYKIGLSKGTEVIKEEVAATDITAGTFYDLDLNTSYTVTVYVTNKEEFDCSLVTQEVQTKKGTITGVSFENKTFVYDGNPKSLEVKNLPQGASVNYTGNAVATAGTHEVTAVVQKENYNDLTLKATMTISKADQFFAFEDKVVTYNGQPQVMEAETDLEVTIEYYSGETKLEGAPTNAGTYKAKAIYAGDANYNKVELEATLVINKATYDMSGVTFNDATYTYDTEEKELLISGTLPEGVTVTYANNKLTNAGTTTAKAEFSGDAENYNAINSMEATLTINKADVTITSSNIEIVQGETYAVDYTCSLDGVSITTKFFSGSEETEKPTLAGNYTAVISFAGNENYNAASRTITIIIKNPSYEDVTITLEDIVATYGQSYAVEPVADHDVTIEDLEIEYEDSMGIRTKEKPVNAGEYKIFITFAQDDEKYLNSALKEVNLTINKADKEFELTNNTVTYNGNSQTLTSPTQIELTYEYYMEDVKLDGAPVNAGTYTVKAIYAGDENHLETIKTAILTIDKADPSTEGLQKTFNRDYEVGMTLEMFKTTLENNKYYCEDYTLVLQPNENKITVIYNNGDDNYNAIEVEITLKCNPKVISVEVVDGGRQIKGRPFDSGNLVVTYGYNDGTSKVIEKPEITVSLTPDTNADTFEVTITLSDNKLEESLKNKTLTIHTIAKPEVMIYAVYGGGGNSGATYKNDFVILYNNSNQDIDLTGWSLQYGSAGASGILSSGDSNMKKLSGTIKAYGFYTVVAAAGNNAALDLPFLNTADDISALTIGGTNFKVYLSTTTTPINAGSFNNSNCVDMVGAGTATNVEGTAAPAPTSAATYIKRKTLKDTDNNAEDFEVVSFIGTNDFNYLSEGHNAYNYAFAEMDKQNINFMNLKDGFTVPTEYKGVNITWTMTPQGGLEITDGTATITASEYIGKLIGTVDGYPFTLEYNVVISNRELLTAPTVSLNHFTVSWAAIDNAAGYDIYIDDVLYATTTETSYDLYDSNFETTFANMRSYKITVIAKAVEGDTAHANSIESTPVQLNFADLSDISGLNGVYTFKVAVTQKGVWSTQYNNANFFVRDFANNQGLLVFRYTNQTVFDSLTAGQIIYISGTYSLSNKMPQISSIKGITIADGTQSLDDITVARELESTDISQRISLTDAEVITKASGGNVSVKVDDFTFNLYANTTYLPSITEINALLPGNKLNFSGAVGVYGDNIQVYLTSYEITSTEVSDDYKLEVSLPEAVAKLNNSYTSGATVNDLLVSGTTYSDVSVAYSVTEGAELATIEESTLTFGTVTEATTIKIKVTVSLGGNLKEIEKEITLKPAGSSTEKSLELKYDGTTTINMEAGATANNSTNIGDTNNLFNVSSAKNSASNQVGLNKNDHTMRLYAHASSGNGTSLTISGNTTTIVKVSVTFKAASSTCNVNINGTQFTATTTNQTQEITITNNEFSIQNVNSVNVQLYISSIVITYLEN